MEARPQHLKGEQLVYPAEVSPQTRLDRFHATVDNLRSAGVDSYERAHYGCLSDVLTEHGAVYEVFGNFLEYYSALTPDNAALRTVKSSQALEAKGDPTFPRGRDNPEAWLQTFDRLVKDTEYRHRYLFNLILPVTSNVSERSKLLKAAVLLHDVRNPSVLDIGASLNHNLKRLALFNKGRFTYEETEIMKRDPVTGKMLGDERLVKQQIAFNRLVNSKGLLLERSLGLDVWQTQRDMLYREWAISNSFYMSELLDAVKVDLFNRLDKSDPPEVEFRMLDITDETEAAQIDRRFTVIYLSTVLYQLPGPKVQTILKRAQEYVEPDGLMVVQDFVDFKPDGSYQFYTKSDWRGNYGVWVLDMKQPEKGFLKYFSADYGRARQLVLEPALGDLAVARELGLTPSAYD